MIGIYLAVSGDMRNILTVICGPEVMQKCDKHCHHLKVISSQTAESSGLQKDALYKLFTKIGVILIPQVLYDLYCKQPVLFHFQVD